MTDMEKLELITKLIDEAGGRVFFVGGYVRDEILGLPPKDIDVEIHGVSVQVVKQILSKFGKVDLIGESFGVLKVMGLDIDFSFPRTERRVGKLHTDFEVSVDPFMSTMEAAKRRDFTMGAIMKDVLTGEVIDHFGGVADIQEGIIRFVDKDTFIEDSLRPLRAARFSARFGMKIDSELIELAKTMDYTQLSSERVSEEVKKTLLASQPSLGFLAMKEMGIIEQLFPTFFELVGCEQSKVHHPEGDVFTHTMLVIDQASKLKEFSSDEISFMYGSLLHDIGKPSTTIIHEDGRVTAHGHECVSPELIERAFTELSIETTRIPYVEMMVAEHMRVKTIDVMKKTKVRRLIAGTPVFDLLLFTVADSVRGEDVSTLDLFTKVKFVEQIQLIERLSMGELYTIIPIVTGKDLIEIGYTPGPDFKGLLNEAFTMQIASDYDRERILTVFKGRVEA